MPSAPAPPIEPAPVPAVSDALTLGFVEATDRLDRGFLSLALLYGVATAILGVLVAPFNQYDDNKLRSLVIGAVALVAVSCAWRQRQTVRRLVEERPSRLLIGVFIGIAILWAGTGWRSSYYLLSYAVIPVAAVLASWRWALACGLLLSVGYLGGLVVHGYTWEELGVLRDQDSIVANALGYPFAALFFSTAASRMVGFVARISQIVGQTNLRSADAEPVAKPPERLRTKALTPREVQVAQLVAIGLTNDQVAEQLVVSPRTVHSHVGNALRKTGSANRTELGMLAVREGLVPVGGHPASAERF